METGPSFVAYIDEAGDEGFKFGAGSSEHFILSAVLGLKQDEKSFESIIDVVKQAIASAQGDDHPFNKKEALHFRKLRHEQRKYYTSQIAQEPITTVSIVVLKKAFAFAQSLIDEKHLYNFAAGELIKRVLLWCDDNSKGNVSGDGTLQLVFSNRSSLNTAILSKYWEQLFALDLDLAPIVQRRFRAKQVLALPHTKKAGLQVADAVASSQFYFYELNSYGQTETSYAKNIAFTSYSRDGGTAGLVFIPNNVARC